MIITAIYNKVFANFFNFYFVKEDTKCRQTDPTLNDSVLLFATEHHLLQISGPPRAIQNNDQQFKLSAYIELNKQNVDHVRSQSYDRFKI